MAIRQFYWQEQFPATFLTLRWAREVGTYNCDDFLPTIGTYTGMRGKEADEFSPFLIRWLGT